MSQVQDLLAGRCAVLTLRGGLPAGAVPAQAALLPGSFNPLHHGHLRLAYAVTCLTGRPVLFELSMLNIDKGALTPAELATRLAAFPADCQVVISRAPLFLDKARLLPGRTFVLGYDTAQRLLDEHYYGSAARRDETLAEFERLGCRFLVAGRRSSGRFRTLADLQLPEAYRGLFAAVPPALFSADVSSTAIRAGFQAPELPKGAVL